MNGNCYFSEGLNPTLTCGAHQKRTMVGYNATLKSGGGMTETALALNARDYKGLSGSKQMMTAAAMLIEDDT